MEHALNAALPALAAGATAYGLLVGGLYAFQRRLMYRPRGRLPSPAEAGVPGMSAVSCRTGDGLDLVSWWQPPADDGLALVYLHGNEGNLGHRAHKVRAYLDRGLGVLLAGYRGYGFNPGQPHEAGLVEDGLAAVRFVESRGIPPERIVLYGESLGSGVAVQVAAATRVGAVVLEAPFTSIADVAALQYPYVPARQLVLDRFDSAGRIAAIGAPLLILHGERDRVVPAEHARRLHRVALEPKALRLWPEAGHLDLYEHGAAHAVLDFLHRCVISGDGRGPDC